MPKVMEIIEKETKGKSYHTYKYSYDSIGLPSIDYDDDPNKVMKWKDSGETDSPKGAVDLKHLADQLQQLGERPLLKYFLDGSRHVFKVDDIAYNKQVFPVVAGQIGVGCCRRENKRMQKERFYRELVLALPDKANADGWDDAAYFAMLEKVLEKYVLPEEGTICFTEKDRKRMPQGYMEKVYETAKKKGGSLELTETVPDGMDGGFILTYGGIEENCTIKALFDARREELSDKVNRQLFTAV